MFLRLYDSMFFKDGSKVQQGTITKRKASDPLTVSLGRKRTKVLDYKGIICKFGFYYALS